MQEKVNRTKIRNGMKATITTIAAMIQKPLVEIELSRENGWFYTQYDTCIINVN